MARFAAPTPSPSPSHKKSSRSCAAAENSPAAGKSSPRRRGGRMPLELLDPQGGDRFVSGPDFDFEGRFAAAKTRESFHSRRMSLAPQQQEKDPSIERRRQRRMSLQAGSIHRLDKNGAKKASKIHPSGANAKNKGSSPPPVLVEKLYIEKSASVLWRDGLLQQWDNLLDNTSGGFKSITVAYEEHRKSLEPDPKQGDDQAQISSPCSCEGETSSSKDIHMVEISSEESDVPRMDEISPFPEKELDQELKNKGEERTGWTSYGFTAAAALVAAGIAILGCVIHGKVRACVSSS
ncbi:hypothetical protein SELMODRAFT_428044 [Selaginella moellendorffii]|uniref:Uncharacterized protein n=1 Tax=Selaginella moellendorffii TaxID=88036 RepID=D8T1I7_SELML|nr:hypothetical protein SELMODRAFT_428044 [Selaginella moellendorffii]